MPQNELKTFSCSKPGFLTEFFLPVNDICVIQKCMGNIFTSITNSPISSKILPEYLWNSCISLHSCGHHPSPNYHHFPPALLYLIPNRFLYICSYKTLNDLVPAYLSSLILHILPLIAQHRLHQPASIVLLTVCISPWNLPFVCSLPPLHHHIAQCDLPLQCHQCVIMHLFELIWLFPF